MGEVSRGLLDTSVLIALADEPGLLDALPQDLAISAATLAELHFGVLLAKDDVSRRKRLLYLGSVESVFQPLALDAAVARAFATVAHAVQLAGRKPRSRTMDLWIAATALVHRYPLYTRNPDDFQGLQKLVDVRVI